MRIQYANIVMTAQLMIQLTFILKYTTIQKPGKVFLFLSRLH